MASAVTFIKNVALRDPDTGGQTSTVGEPSVGTGGNVIFFTGNWYAARSTDNASSWQAVDPFTALPSVDGGFCCDQTVIRVPGHDLTIWLLQYIEENGTNTLRVAFNDGALDNAGWQWWDLKPEQVNADWRGEWFDYNHAALSDNFLYVGTNVFTSVSEQWTRAVLFRFPLAVLAASGDLTFDYFESTENFSLRCTQGAGSTMYFASHNSLSQIRVFSWPEASQQVTTHDIDVTPWKDGVYRAPGPDGRNWLGRCDQRITGAWLSGGRIGVAWSANADAPSRPFPFVRVVRVDEATMSVVEDRDIWNSKYAYAYPDAAPNGAGDVGVTLFRGGGPRFPDHVVGFFDEAASAWRLRATRNGTNGPSDGKWGDYVTCRPHVPDAASWVAAGFTLQGGGGRTDIEPRYIHFRRRSGS